MLNILRRLHEKYKRRLDSQSEGQRRYYYEKGDYKKALSLLIAHSQKKIQQESGLPLEIKNEIKFLLVSPEATHADYERVIKHADSLDFSLLPYQKWLSLSKLTTQNGCLRLASIFRRNALMKVINIKSSTGQGHEALFIKAIIDTNSRSMLTSSEFKNENNAIFQYAFDIGCSPPRFPSSEKTDDILLNYLKNKSIAIVGPSPSNETQGEEIDKFDVVARVSFNPQGQDTENIYGSRTNLAYYGDHFSERISKQRKIIEHLGKIEFVSLKSTKSISKLQAIAPSLKNVRIFSGPKYLFFSGSPMMIQNILHDVLSCQPSRVKLFNTTLYLDDQNHRADYYFGDFPQSQPLLERFKLYSGFAHHDFISNFNYVKNLYQNGFIELDKICESVISLSTADYVCQLEKKYFQRTVPQLLNLL